MFAGPFYYLLTGLIYASYLSITFSSEYIIEQLFYACFSFANSSLFEEATYVIVSKDWVTSNLDIESINLLTIVSIF
jgi:hypothetical protein